MFPSEEKYVKVEPEKLQKLIESLPIKITNAEISGNLWSFPQPLIQQNIACETLLIKCHKKEVREDDFIDFLYKYSAIYTLRYKDLLPENYEKMTPRELVDHYVKNIMDIAKSANRVWHKKDRYAGEMGEILLFLLLETKGITQLLNKMSLKTSPNEAVKGLDGIHIGSNGNDILLYYGQSKLEKRFSDSLSNALKDVESYHNDPDKEDLEFQLAKSDLDHLKFGDHAAIIPHLLSAYYRDAEQIDKVNALLLGYDWEILATYDPVKVNDLTDYLKPLYEKESSERTSQITEGISKKTSISKKNYLIFVLPFRDIDDMREKWNKKIGAQTEDDKQVKKKEK